MDLEKLLDHPVMKLNPRLLTWTFNQARRIPYVRDLIEAEYDKLMGDVRDGMHPYDETAPKHAALPKKAVTRAAILDQMKEFNALEDPKWKEGYASGTVYNDDEEHVAFLNEVYALNSQSNPLHSDIWPSAVKYEAEIVSMTADMLGATEIAGDPDGPERIVGAVSSGGTESILLAMKTYRDRARAEKGITAPEMVTPVTAHAAFDKAAQFFGMKHVKIPIGDDYRADVTALRKAVNKNTVVIVGSAPAFPHGIVDPIEEMSEYARKRDIGFHTDGCLGGFVLPWARKLGADVPGFDFRLPGVTSMSADTHKYGYAAKGTSVVLYRGVALRRYQYFTIGDWPGGLYFSPTLAGSRPGALSAACWAAMLARGEEGYLDATQKILDTAEKIKAGIGKIRGLEVMGNPLWVIAFKSETVDIYRVMAEMTERGWSLNGLHKPACVHIAVTLRHANPGVAERFLKDLEASVDAVRDQPVSDEEGAAPVYGMANAMPVKGVIGDVLKRYLDALYEV